MKKILTTLLIASILLFSFGMISAEVNAVTPSTNDLNRDNGWAHVDETNVGIGEVTLNFVSQRAFYSCFEYRTDGDTSQKTSDSNYNPGVTDGLYPYYCQNNNERTVTFSADEYVEVRMVFGAETDERFDWTRFDVFPVLTPPEITGFLNPTLPCGAVTNIHSTTIDWTDSTGGSGIISGYEYTVNYPLASGTGRGNWKNFLTPSRYTGSLNEGLHIIKVRAKDSTGAYSGWSNECSITADWTSPDVEIITPVEGSTVSGIVEVRGTVRDANLLRYWFVIENSAGNYVAGPGTVTTNEAFTDRLLLSWDTSALPDGIYKIKLEARDMAQNKDAGSVDWHTIIVDNDEDNDGVLDDSDNCPTVANADQFDFDSDSLGDVCDEDDDNEGVLDDNDRCEGTSEVDSPLEGLGVNRQVWYGGEYFTTLIPGKKGQKSQTVSEFSLADTHGCSCEQILDIITSEEDSEMNGHYKFGCSKSVIEEWIALE